MNSTIPSQFGNFEIRRLLGSGGMGEVYEAYQPSLQRVVALKVLPEWLGDEPEYVDRFRREAAITAQLDHPNIVPIYDFGREHSRCYFAMKLVRGMSLHELIRRFRLIEQAAGKDAVTVRNGKMAGSDSAVAATIDDPVDRLLDPLPRCLEDTDIVAMRAVCDEFLEERFRFTARVGEMLARALAYAHDRGQIHRDVKPSNAMIDRHGHAYLIDFGLTRSLSQTISQPRAGTPRYLSPEQLDGMELDSRTDIYSLGVTLYELATARVAFGGDSTTLASNIRRGTITSLRFVAPKIPELLAGCIERAMQPDRTARLQSAAEMAEILGEASRGGSTAVRSERTTVALTVPSRVRQRRLQPLFAGGAGLVLTAVAVGAYFNLPKITDTSADLSRELNPLDTAPLLRRQPLLHQEPIALLFEDNPENRMQQSDPVNRRFMVNSDGLVLHRLGTTDAPEYKLDVRLHQNNWIGTGGLFFGFHGVTDGGQTEYRFQSVLVRWLAESRQWRVERSVGRASRRDSTLWYSPVTRGVGAELVAAPAPKWDEDHLLEVSVNNGRIKWIRLAGQEVTSLATDACNDRVTDPAQFVGEFGLLTHKCAITYSDAQVTILRRSLP